jgi:hypothetical protein
MHRLKASEVAEYRATLLEQQAGYCRLCSEPIEQGDAVLDHDHKSGHVRGVLHSGCNAMLGHIENNRPRYRLTGARLRRWMNAAFDYIHGDYSHLPLHHTQRTDDEKRLLKNKRARVARAKKATT